MKWRTVLDMREDDLIRAFYDGLISENQLNFWYDASPKVPNYFGLNPLNKYFSTHGAEAYDSWIERNRRRFIFLAEWIDENKPDLPNTISVKELIKMKWNDKK